MRKMSWFCFIFLASLVEVVLMKMTVNMNEIGFTQIATQASACAYA